MGQPSLSDPAARPVTTTLNSSGLALPNYHNPYGGSERYLAQSKGGGDPTPDPSAPNDPSSEGCKKILDKIDDIQRDIDKRIGEIDEDTRDLPEAAPGDHKKPSLSRRGHRRIVNELKKILARRKGDYLSRCGGPPNGPPGVPHESWLDRKYWEQLTGLSGAALVVYIVISEGSRLFPPRNFVPVP